MIFLIEGGGDFEQGGREQIFKRFDNIEETILQRFLISVN